MPMKKLSFLLAFTLFQSMTAISASESTDYLHCTHSKDSSIEDYYWSITSKDKIERWVNGKPISVINSLVMNNQKNIAWNEMANPMGIFVLDKKTMRQSGTLLTDANQILDRWVSECAFIKKDKFLGLQ